MDIFKDSIELRCGDKRFNVGIRLRSDSQLVGRLIGPEKEEKFFFKLKKKKFHRPVRRSGGRAVGREKEDKKNILKKL